MSRDKAVIAKISNKVQGSIVGGIAVSNMNFAVDVLFQKNGEPKGRWGLQANGAPKGRCGTIKANGVPLRQMWVPKGKWGAIKANGCHEAYGALKAKQALMTFCQGKLDCTSGMRMQSKTDGSR